MRAFLFLVITSVAQSAVVEILDPVNVRRIKHQAATQVTDQNELDTYDQPEESNTIKKPCCACCQEPSPPSVSNVVGVVSKVQQSSAPAVVDKPVGYGEPSTETPHMQLTTEGVKEVEYADATAHESQNGEDYAPEVPDGYTEASSTIVDVVTTTVSSTSEAYVSLEKSMEVYEEPSAIAPSTTAEDVVIVTEPPTETPTLSPSTFPPETLAPVLTTPETHTLPASFFETAPSVTPAPVAYVLTGQPQSSVVESALPVVQQQIVQQQPAYVPQPQAYVAPPAPLSRPPFRTNLQYYPLRCGCPTPQPCCNLPSLQLPCCLPPPPPPPPAPCCPKPPTCCQQIQLPQIQLPTLPCCFSLPQLPPPCFRASPSSPCRRRAKRQTMRGRLCRLCSYRSYRIHHITKRQAPTYSINPNLRYVLTAVPAQTPITQTQCGVCSRSQLRTARVKRQSCVACQGRKKREIEEERAERQRRSCPTCELERKKRQTQSCRTCANTAGAIGYRGKRSLQIHWCTVCTGRRKRQAAQCVRGCSSRVKRALFGMESMKIRVKKQGSYNPPGDETGNEQCDASCCDYSKCENPLLKFKRT